MKRLKKIGIIGPNKSICDTQLYEFGVQLGSQIAKLNRVFICGGHEGFMEAFCKGVKLSKNTYNGQTIGILPGDNPDSANEFIDIAIPTGIGIARNLIIVNSSDIIIAAGGGAGTLSELAFAWQKGKKVLCVTKFEGWAKEFANREMDNREKELLIGVNSIKEILLYLRNE